ncbi:MAG: acireductone synthase [Cyanobacteriota bacterium]|nr:acireductone synthase [Cyanobacteriota bacterium]
MNIDAEIQHVLLDIEGTTCPVSFVGEILFPYASEQVLPYLKKHQAEDLIKRLLVDIHNAWRCETCPEAIELAKNLPIRNTPSEPSSFDNISALSQALSAEDASIYLHWLIKEDRKLTVLKDLQGLIWEEGYKEGILIAPLFTDVPDALRRWHGQDLKLAVYSSGSVKAQKLLYSHTNHGNLSHFFTHWFDTHTGPKKDPDSYARIATALQAKPENIVFISDSPGELKAAKATGLNVLFSDRPGNTYQNTIGFPSTQTFADITFNTKHIPPDPTEDP